MTALQIIEKKGNDAVRRLRLQKLRSGHPFMINSNDLESYQCYLEYPDGSIKLVLMNRLASVHFREHFLLPRRCRVLRRDVIYLLGPHPGQR
jgi:hydrogenase maturation factor HypF (carbamoyltransferase family)